MAYCYKRITSDQDGTAMYCILDTREHELNRWLRRIDFQISFSLGEFVAPQSPWVISTPLLGSPDEEKFVSMMDDFDSMMAERLGGEWDKAKEWFDSLPFEDEGNIDEDDSE